MNSKLAITGIYYEDRSFKGCDEFHRFLYDGHLVFGNSEGASQTNFKTLYDILTGEGNLNKDSCTLYISGDCGEDLPEGAVSKDLLEVVNEYRETKECCFETEAVFIFKKDQIACGIAVKKVSSVYEKDRVYSLIDLDSKIDTAPQIYINDGLEDDDPVSLLLREENRKKYCSNYHIDYDFSILPYIITGAICIYNRFFPASKLSLKDDQDSPYFIPEKSMTWFGKRALSIKYKDLYLYMDGFGSDKELRPNKYVAYATPYIIPLSGDNETDILKEAELFENDLLSSDVLSKLSRSYYEKYLSNRRKYTVVLTANSRDDLKKELFFLKNGLNNSFVTGDDFVTPNGSYFTPDPLGENGKVAFVYPGVGSVYTGVGQDIFQMYPELYSFFATIVDDPSKVIKDKVLYPRGLTKFSEDYMKESDRKIRNNIKAISESGIAFSLLYTLEAFGFGIKPDMALGYSMGEVGMFASLGVWKNPGKLSKRLLNSDTFNNRLTGNLDAIRDCWSIDRDVENSTIWGQYTVFAHFKEVDEVLKNEDRVFITLINTEDEIVIAGDPKECERVISEQGYRYFPLKIALAIHSPPAYTEYDKLVDLFSLEVNEDSSDINIYSSSCYLNVPKREKTVANSIARTFCERVDFPKLVKKTYADGARIYIETGPRKICCQWIDEILKDKRKVTVPLNVKGIGDIKTIVKAVAKLVSHGVDMDLTKFYRAY